MDHVHFSTSEMTVSLTVIMRRYIADVFSKDVLRLESSGVFLVSFQSRQNPEPFLAGGAYMHNRARPIRVKNCHQSWISYDRH